MRYFLFINLYNFFYFDKQISIFLIFSFFKFVFLIINRYRILSLSAYYYNYIILGMLITEIIVARIYNVCKIGQDLKNI